MRKLKKKQKKQKKQKKLPDTERGMKNHERETTAATRAKKLILCITWRIVKNFNCLLRD
jgi:hypothetical protein